MIGEDELLERLQEVCAEFDAKYPLKTGYRRYFQVVETAGRVQPTHVRTVWTDGRMAEVRNWHYPPTPEDHKLSD